MLNKLTPNLMVEDVAQTIVFYRDTLGFDVAVTVPDEAPFNFAIMGRDGVEIMFQSRASLGEDVPVLAAVPIGASQTFYIEVSGVAALYEQLRGKVEIVVELHSTFYDTTEFYFRDINGYILSFSEPEQPTVPEPYNAGQDGE